MRQIAPKGETTRFPSQPSDVYMSGGEYYVKGTSRTGPAVSGLDEEPEVLYDETGKAYIIDPDTGEKIYVTVDPDTGKVTPTTAPLRKIRTIRTHQIQTIRAVLVIQAIRAAPLTQIIQAIQVPPIRTIQAVIRIRTIRAALLTRVTRAEEQTNPPGVVDD